MAAQDSFILVLAKPILELNGKSLYETTWPVPPMAISDEPLIPKLLFYRFEDSAKILVTNDLALDVPGQVPPEASLPVRNFPLNLYTSL